MSDTPSRFDRFEGKRAAGRPRFFDPDELREVWLFVEEGRARCNLSVNAFCGPRRSFTWLRYKMNNETRKYELKPVQIAGKTLQRRYYEACDLLRKEAKSAGPYWGILKLFRGKRPDDSAPSALEAHWRAELARRLCLGR